MNIDNFDADALTEMPFGLAGRVYRSPMPFRPGDEDGELLDRFREAEIQVVVILLPRQEYMQKARRDLASLYRQGGMQIIEMPIVDYSIPEPVLLDKALDESLELARSGKNIVIHCFAGFGRTGTFLACMAVRLLEFSGQQAIEWVRQYVPPALENLDQTQFVVQYGESHADHKC